ncbi:WD repeat-containing protein 43 [Aedes albopictus]|uniref:Small-subunit processome Utp12 domain-containing protein n=1 Tax=Aedes albopictus TaxID=7160 RepID=A0ABM2A118_AEDAL
MSRSSAREYSRDGKYFAFINSQGKLVVYEVETSNVSQIYTPNLHLNVPCTCFAWVEVGGQSSSAKKKKKRSSTTGTEGERKTCVIFGTSKGTVSLYGLASGTVEKEFEGAGHSGPITALCIEGDCLFTAGSDGKVVEWSLTNCVQRKVHNLGVEKLSCLVVIEQGSTILAGSKQLKLWDLDKERATKTLVGHTSNTVLTRKIVSQDGGTFVLTGSVNDRNVSLWSTEGDERTAVGLFTLDDAPEYLSARMVGGKLHLVAVSRSGVAHYFIKSFDKININKPIKANYTYEVALDTAGSGSKAVDRLPIFTASVDFSANQEQILVGYGSDLSLKFEQITIDKDLKHNVIIREQTKGMLPKDKSERDLKAKTPAVDKSIAEYLNPVNASKKSLKTVEIPMEARLENLALTADGGDSRSRASQKNMVHLLVQGLHSKDAEILRSVFSKNDPEQIQRTAERIPAQYVSALLNELSSLMQKKTVHVATAVCWLKALIHSHASQLMALGSESLLSNFGTCLGIIEYRVEHANSLSKLSGRLGLLVSQIDRTERLAKNPDEVANPHVLVYQEEDDSDVDSVIGKDHGSSDEEYDGMMDDDGLEDGEEEDDYEDGENALAGSFVRVRNGTAKRGDGSMLKLKVDEESSDQDDEDEEDDEEMEVSD